MSQGRSFAAAPRRAPAMPTAAGWWETYLIAATAVSLFVFAYSTQFGKLPILVFYGLWLPLPLLLPQILGRGLRRIAPLFVLPALMLASVAWSAEPGSTLRAAIQYGSTVACALVAARTVELRTLARGGTVGTLLVLAWSYAAGRYSYDAMDGSYAFAGAFASKNQLGLFASLGLVWALGVIALVRDRPGWCLAALATLVWSGVTLIMSQSATALISTIAAVLCAAIAGLLLYLPVPLRRVGVATAVFLLVVALVAALAGGAYEQVLSATGKDPTLTGRTYLWSEGVAQGHRKPLLGIGYEAFWVRGRPLAEELWELFYIEARTGFHFHNTFIEAYVALGAVGLITVLAMYGALLICGLRLLTGPAGKEALLPLALVTMFVVRTVVEVDFLTPYTIGAFLVHYLLLAMADRLALWRHARRRTAAAI